MREWKRYRDVVLVVLLLVLPFYILRSNMKKPEQRSAMDRAVLRVSAPVEFVSSSMARGMSDVLTDYVYLVDVKADNERLAYDNARLRESVRRLEQSGYENRELRRLLQLREAQGGDYIAAQVITKDFSEFFRVSRVVLDRGSAAIRPHMPVLAADGVVGKVLHVAGDTIDVELAVDAHFGVDVEDERTHARGFVRGTGDPRRYACRVEMVDSRDDVEIGDLFVTSGKGKWFPRGLPVARVTKVQKRELGREQDIEAEPTVDFSRLDAVLVLVTPDAADREAASP